MFKNAIIYRITNGWTPPDLITMEDALGCQRFEPCGPTQQKSTGWQPPRGEGHGALVEAIVGHRILRHRILRFQIETKTVPGPVIKKHLDERVAKIEETEGRKPGKKEKRELADEIRQTLLPQAFAKTASVWVWIDIQNGRLVLDTASQGRADDVIAALVRAFEALQLAPLNTSKPPQLCMTAWLMSADNQPLNLTPGRFVELQSTDEFRSLVKFDRHHLDDEQMRLHIGQGKLPTRLALEWDGRVAFVLTDSLTLRKIDLLDVPEDETEEDAFDADVTIATSELTALITDLVDALGGEAA